MQETRNKPTCTKCNQAFQTPYGLEVHMRRKIPCDRVLKCGKCNKIFKKTSNLKQHLARKTPCEPVQGNMLGEITNNKCRYCGRTMKNKYILTKHYTTCKIKNGGMEMLFARIEAQQNENKQLAKRVEELEVKSKVPIMVNHGTINNHFNTQINLPLICFGSDKQRIKMIKIVQENLNILYRPAETGISYDEQLRNRIGEFVTAIYRNPKYLDMQGIYTKHGFELMDKDNVFTFDDSKWHIGDWGKVSKEMIQSIERCFFKLKGLNKKNDALEVIRAMIAAGQGKSMDDFEITDENLQELYCEIGKKLGFDTLELEIQRIE
jgi:hypothetical protein